MKSKLRKFGTYVVRFMRHNIGFFLLVTLTACAAIQPALPGTADTVRVVNLAQSDLAIAQSNGMKFCVTGDCSTFWLSWQQNGTRIFAMARATTDNIAVLPRGLEASGAEINEVENRISQVDWQQWPKAIPLALGAATGDPGLIMISLAGVDLQHMGWEEFSRLAYPQVVD